MLERYGMATEQNINALAKSKYAQISGTNLDADIDENTHGNLVSGFINGLTFGIAQDKSGDQVREELLGIEEPRGAAVTRTIGSVAGGAAAGAATGAAIGTFLGGPGIGTAIGAGVGAVGFPHLLGYALRYHDPGANGGLVPFLAFVEVAASAGVGLDTHCHPGVTRPHI